MKWRVGVRVFRSGRRLAWAVNRDGQNLTNSDMAYVLIIVVCMVNVPCMVFDGPKYHTMEACRIEQAENEKAIIERLMERLPEGTVFSLVSDCFTQSGVDT